MPDFRPFLFSAAGTLIVTSGQAASLRISPIGIDMPSSQRAAAVTLDNNDSEPVNIQIRIFHWSQANGEDRLEPATDMLVSPPAATVPSGASYTIRVARRAAVPVAGEQSYRLFIDELPKPIDPRTVSRGVSMVLRTSMPVFVADKRAVAKLGWKVWQDVRGVHVQVTNSGQRHARIVGLTFQQPSGPAIAFGGGISGYVLAGTSKRFDALVDPKVSLPVLIPGGRGTLTGKDGGLDIKEEVVVGSQ